MMTTRTITASMMKITKKMNIMNIGRIQEADN